MLIKTNRKIINIEDIENMAKVAEILMVVDGDGVKEVLIITDIGDIVAERGTEEFDKLMGMGIYRNCVIYKHGDEYRTIDAETFKAVREIKENFEVNGND